MNNTEERLQKCRTQLSAYNMQKRYLTTMTSMQSEIHMRKVEDSVHLVEGMLKRIGDVHGEEAREIVADIYVNRCKQAEAACIYGYSLRTLQRKCRTWLLTAVQAYDA